MTDSTPPDNASLPHLRLDADRAREELETTIDEIQRLAQPAELVAAARRSIRRNPLPVSGVAVAAVAIIGSIVFVRLRKGRRG